MTPERVRGKVCCRRAASVVHVPRGDTTSDPWRAKEILQGKNQKVSPSLLTVNTNTL